MMIRQVGNMTTIINVSVFQMEAYAAELKQLETLFSDMDGGLTPGSIAEMKAALRATKELVDDLRDNTELLAGNNAISP